MRWAIVPAAGCGMRSGAPKNKVVMPLLGVPVLIHTLRALIRGGVDAVALCGAPGELSALETLTRAYGVDAAVRILPGGLTRAQTVALALEALEADLPQSVIIHDAARPLASADLIAACLDAARQGAFAAAVPVRDTIKQARAQTILHTPDRASLWAAQTPQGGPYGALLSAYRLAGADGFLNEATDDASVCEHAGMQVRILPGEPENIKITQPCDFTIAQALLAQREGIGRPAGAMRVGTGYDVHRFAPDRALVLCGVQIPFEKGLLGHSDADVALHALMDAMLGAAALGDIGGLFPDTDMRYRGVSSMKLLAQVCQRVGQNGYALENADIPIVAQQPRLMPYIMRMRENIAGIAGLPVDTVSVKATTTERLGFEGRGEGISAQASVLLRRMV